MTERANPPLVSSMENAQHRSRKGDKYACFLGTDGGSSGFNEQPGAGRHAVGVVVIPGSADIVRGFEYIEGYAEIFQPFGSRETAATRTDYSDLGRTVHSSAPARFS